jgi:hypothetical protein
VPLGVGLAVLLQVSPLVAAWSAPLASYNPLLGGARTAERFMPVGWGEGLAPITDYLRAQPEAELRSVGIWNAMADNLQAHLPGPVVAISVSNRGQVNNERDFDQLDYYVDYVFARQQRMTPRELAGRTPELVSTIDGVAYARLYRLK